MLIVQPPYHEGILNILIGSVLGFLAGETHSLGILS